MTRVAELSRLDRDAFVAEVGFAFESSPWVAEAAWEERPFGSLDELHAAMVRAVARAPAERQLELIRAHPELAGAGADDLTPESAAEQASAGLDGSDGEERARLQRATASYRERFGFPFVVCVREHTPAGIVANVEERLGRSPDQEHETALDEIAKIAALRLEDRFGPGALHGIAYEISYGKASVPVYRHYAKPLAGLPEVPESAFRGRDNVLFANEITVEVFGDNFLRAYTRGDNSSVVATDSMKNFILSEAGEHEGATLEGYLARLGAGFLDRYEQMQSVRVSGRELPFEAMSEVLRRRGPEEHSVAALRYERRDDGPTLVEQRSGRVGMELLKVKGSAFTRFVRDEYTTLPERTDRPLFIRLDLHWSYGDPLDALGEPPERYVAGEQARDVCAAVFDELVSESIQQLVHVMGERLLERYPQLATVEFAAANMTRDPHDEEGRVFVPPFPAFGTITLRMTRSR